MEQKYKTLNETHSTKKVLWKNSQCYFWIFLKRYLPLIRFQHSRGNNTKFNLLPRSGPPTFVSVPVSLPVCLARSPIINANNRRRTNDKRKTTNRAKRSEVLTNCGVTLCKYIARTNTHKQTTQSKRYHWVLTNRLSGDTIQHVCSLLQRNRNGNNKLYTFSLVFFFLE